jgi:hypothetical protein
MNNEADGSGEKRSAAFRTVRDAITAHIEQFIAAVPPKGGHLP